MSNLLHHTVCPACGAGTISTVFSVKDYTVSGEEFVIFQCNSCTLRFTQDAPDAASIGPFYKSENYISHTNTAAGFISRLYLQVRKKTLRQKRKLLQKQTGRKTGTLLDIGSGTGAFVHEMKQHSWQADGLEPDAGARELAKQLYNLSLSPINELWNLKAESYDAITLWHVLEHVHDLSAYFQQLKKLVKPTGKIFIAVPNYTSKDAAIYKQYWAAYDVPRHLYHFSPQSMRTLMERHGLTIKEYKPMWYDSFYISMLSSKYKKGRVQLLAACWNGLRSNLAAWGNTKKCSSVIYIISKQE